MRIFPEALSIFLCAVLLPVTGKVSALEPVTAMDDGFTLPSERSMIEGSLLYPGSESYIGGGFAICAWRIPFGIEELAVTSVHGGLNSDKVGISFSFNSSGFDLYGEEQEKIGLSYSPHKAVSTGVRLTRNAMRIKGFGNSAAISADLGVILHPFETLFLAASLENIANAELGKSNEPLDGSTRFAASWAASENIMLISSVTKVRRFSPSFSAGFSVEILSVLTLGVVGGNEPDRFEFIGTVAASGLHFTYRGSHHRDLGMSHGFSICWGYGRKKL